MTDQDIVIKGAREHNLQDVDLRLPKNRLIVMTGVSGSGKSSLAFDTLYAEGQRRYVESLSSYARQFLGQLPKPDVDSITGLAPSISIQQKTAGRNPRSTVGTITEIFDYLRVLFARVGQGHCPTCDRPITAQAPEQIIDSIACLPEGTRFTVLAPLIQRQKGEYRDLFEDLLKRGFVRARVDGRIVQLGDDIRLDKQMKHTIDVVVDRLTSGKTPRTRLAEAVESALKLADGRCVVSVDDEETVEGLGLRVEGEDNSSDPQLDRLYSAHYACTHCGISYEPPSPQLFSFNSPQGMCLDCNGLGERFEFVMDRMIPDESLSLWDGAIELLGPIKSAGQWRKHIYASVAATLESDFGLKAGSVLKSPWNDLPDDVRRALLHGLGDRQIVFEWKYNNGSAWKHAGKFAGLLPELLTTYSKTHNTAKRKQLEKYMEFARCSSCGGTRLCAQARSVSITTASRSHAPRGNVSSDDLRPSDRSPLGADPSDRDAERRAARSHAERGNENERKLALNEVCALSIQEAYDFFEALELGPTGQLIACEVLKEIRGRLGFLLRCGLDYLTLDRAAPTLSGGESQRIRLAGQIGCGLVGVVYILDEPSIGLHPRDNQMLLDSLCELRDQGNTVIVVEHDDETMRAADHIIDFGPGPGVRGGRVVAEGSYADVLKSKESVTAAYLSGRRVIDVPSRRIGVERAEALRSIHEEVGKGRRGEGEKRRKEEAEKKAKRAGQSKSARGLKSVSKVTPSPLRPFPPSPLLSKQLRILNAKHHNLKDVTVNIPLEAFVCVTGVSGSGKSSLINDILWQVLNRDLNKGDGSPGPHRAITGLEHLDKAIDIDQSPIGRTPRSNPATYVKVFDLIRDLYTQLPDSKRHGYKPGRFSFNVSGGRCEACEGNGSNKLEMDFLADLWVTCPVCGGHRFNHETLEVKFKELSIADVLELDVQQALKHFENVAPIARLLQTLHDVGLDYIKLGQPSPTLSGGEAQRIKLARELGKRSTGRTVYLLDEPTTGLHFADIHRLLDVLHGFVNAKNTVIVVEHNLDVIKTADWVIDLGPEGGSGGGRIVCCGTPEDVAACEASHTGRALRAVLDPRSHAPRGNGKSDAPRPVSARDAERHGLRSHAECSHAERGNKIERVITIKGAAQHNLQHIDLTIPRDSMNVFCGPSGSGKSSLAMDTLYAEGQRRYVESLSSYARQFLGQMPKPRVEHIHGLSPAIAIEQKTTGSTPRSTVGTVTEVYDYVRLLWCRLGTLHCPDCGIAVTTQTTDEVIDSILAGVEGLGLRVEGKPRKKRMLGSSGSSSTLNPLPSTLLILAPQEIKVGEKYERLWESLRSRGFARVRIDGATHRLDEVPEIDRKSKHVVDVVVDRVKVEGAGVATLTRSASEGERSTRPENDCSENDRPLERSPSLALRVSVGGNNIRSRLAGSIEQAFDLGRGFIRVAHVDDSAPEEHWRVDSYSLHNACRQCGRGFEELTPHNFSFNSPLGWCPTCEGLGVQQGTDMARLVHEPRKTLSEGAVTAWPSVADSPLFRAMLETLASELNIPLDVPFDRLDPRHKRVILHGAGERWFEVNRSDEPGGVSPRTRSKVRGQQPAGSPGSIGTFRFQYKGLYPAIEEAGRVSYSYRQTLFGMTGEVACSACDGSRLRDDAANMRLRDHTLHQLCELPLNEAMKFLNDLKLSAREKKIAGDLLAEATHRLKFLVDVGLNYLSLSRTLPTLSGGECQRIRLAGQIGRALTGVLYVLDEPTIGLHPRDNGRLLEALKKLRDLGNTLVLVEHDREVLGAADRLYDFGPGAGRLGGTVTAEGTPKQLGKDSASLTGQYLSGRREIPIPATRRMASEGESGRAEKGKKKCSRTRESSDRSLTTSATAPNGWLELTGARHHNLRNVHLKIPLGTLTVVTGVSGSGKSSLIQETLAKAIARQLQRLNETPGPFDELIGLKQIDKLIVVDQQPLGSTPKSNPGTYTGVFDDVRELFSQLPESKVRGYRAGRFSFNRSGGRCEPCEGNGQKMIEMHFLPDVWIECDQCRGKRYNAETLSVKYRGHSIADVLDMPIGKSLELFDNVPRIRGPLATLCAVGLDYLTLGQSAPTLSGGEAQRVKLAAELARPQTGRTMYILDEPTTGLHFDDIDKLLKVLNSLVEKGNTVVVIEHNLDVIKTADWLIDLGPEAGDGGGWIVAEGTPEMVVKGFGFQVEGLGLRVEGKAKRSATASPSTFNPQPSNFISHTARALAPILAAGKRAEREIFDADAARKRRESDLRLSDLSREVKNPWEMDGRKWHTLDRVAKNGRACRWDGEILARVIDLVEEIGEQFGLAASAKPRESKGTKPKSRKLRRAANEDDSSQLATDDESVIQVGEPVASNAGSTPIDQRSQVTTNWSRRDLVEVFGPLPAAGPFVQAWTDHEMVLTLTLRTPRGTFQQEELEQQLKLKPFTAAEGFMTSGHHRLALKTSPGPRGPWGPMHEVRLSLHRLDEIDRSEFWTIVRTAAETFLTRTT